MRYHGATFDLRSCFIAVPWYLRNCQAGAERIDLDGNAAGAVTAAQAVHASDVLKAKKKKTTATPATASASATHRNVSLLTDLNGGAIA